ncbi:reverse transcriptase domain-containing protein [Tanacetum coccineum]
MQTPLVYELTRTKGLARLTYRHLTSLATRTFTPYIAEVVLVEVRKHVNPETYDLDIKENKKRPFILGTPFMTTAKATIKFDKGTITLRSGKNKVSFHRIPDPLCMTDKGVKNDIERIAPTMTVNRLVLEWEERIRLHQEKEIEVDPMKKQETLKTSTRPYRIKERIGR